MDEGKKKEGLTLVSLAAYDDLITDALVDHVYYWSKIRKNKTRYFASRGLREEEVTDAIRKNIIYGKDPATAVQELLKLDGIAKVYNRLNAKHDKEHFRNHLRKYVDMYMPDCPFEVTTSNRYTITVQEAAIVAKKFVKRNEPVKYLVGIQVPMTKEEEKNLGMNRKDFSVVMSRKKQAMLFLGPARFANHDCDANAKLSGTGLNGMMVVARKDIDVDDEITVSYGANYFGEDNCECLCATCEKLRRNGWEPRESKKRKAEADDEVAESVEKIDGDEPRRSKKQKTADEESKIPASRQNKLTNKGKPVRNPSSLAHPKIPDGLEIPNDSELKHLSDQDCAEMVANYIGLLPNAHNVAELLPPILRHRNLIRKESTPLRHDKIAQLQREAAGTEIPTPDDSVDYEGSLHGSGSSRASTTISSIFDNVDPAKSKQDPPIVQNKLTKLAKGNRLRDDVSNSDSQSVGIRQNSQNADESKDQTKESAANATRNKRNTTIDIKDEKTTPDGEAEEEESSGSSDSEDDKPERKPGDWTLTPLLLGTPFSRWVNCRVCHADFVQQEALQTRWACPRCERHIKLYGFQWPKTERQGKADDEPRFTDWRTIHPFLYPDEEKDIRRGKNRALDQIRSEREQEAGSLERESSEAENARTRARTGRGRSRQEAFDKDEEDELEREASPTKRARIERRRERQNAIMEWNLEMTSSPKSAKNKADKPEPVPKKRIVKKIEKKEDNEQAQKYGGVWRKRRRSVPTPVLKPESKKLGQVVPIKRRTHKKPGPAELAASKERINRAIAKLGRKDGSMSEVQDSEPEGGLRFRKNTSRFRNSANDALESEAEHGDDNMSDNERHASSTSQPKTNRVRGRPKKQARSSFAAGSNDDSDEETTRGKRKYEWSGKYARHAVDPQQIQTDENGTPINYYRGRPRKSLHSHILDPYGNEPHVDTLVGSYGDRDSKGAEVVEEAHSPSHSNSVPPSEASVAPLEFDDTAFDSTRKQEVGQYAELLEQPWGFPERSPVRGGSATPHHARSRANERGRLDDDDEFKKSLEYALGPIITAQAADAIPDSKPPVRTAGSYDGGEEQQQQPVEAKRTPIKTRKAQNLNVVYLNRS